MYVKPYVFNGYKLIENTETPTVYWGVMGDDQPLVEHGIVQTGAELGIPNDLIQVEAATAWDAIKTEYDLCQEFGVDVRLLLIASRIPVPQITLELDKHWEFIGFDVAMYSGGYSAVHQDLIFREIDCLKHWRYYLNAYGLFKREADALNFQTQREGVRFTHPEIESYGDFALFMIHRYTST